MHVRMVVIFVIFVLVLVIIFVKDDFDCISGKTFDWTHAIVVFVANDFTIIFSDILVVVHFFVIFIIVHLIVLTLRFFGAALFLVMTRL